MNHLYERNRKIIDAVIEKAKRVCPDALALIGVYGSFATGDIHAHSDLDLLILINDESGYVLSCAFIQEDLQIGHDLYCTTWESLEADAAYPHPNIAKLLDAKIVYCADESYRIRLEELRKKANAKLNAPFSKSDYDAAAAMLKEAKLCYAQAMLAEDLAAVRANAGGALYYLENAVAMLNKRAFRLGVKRIFEEFSAMEKKPEHLTERIEAVVSAKTVDELRGALTVLLRETGAVFEREAEAFFNPDLPTADSLCGTYEEMVSNWRGKMQLAAEEKNRHLAFMSLVSAQAMLNDIAIPDFTENAAVSGYAPDDLKGSAEAYDAFLADYLGQYRKYDTKPRRFPDIDAFIKAYLA